MHSSNWYTIIFLFHVLSASVAAQSFPLKQQNNEAGIYDVSSFAISDLQEGTRDDELKKILSSTGLFSIRIPISLSNPKSSHDLLSSICHCASSFPNIQGGDVNLLTDGRTTRHTLATATMGFERPVSLPRYDLDIHCGSDASNNLEVLRDYVSIAVSNAFLPALDRLLMKGGGNDKGPDDDRHYQRLRSTKPLLVKQNGDEYHTITSIVEDAVHLEHFHVYTKQDTSMSKTPHHKNLQEDPYTLQWHTDAGLFLAYVPATNCHSNEKEVDTSFYIQDRTTTSEQVPKHLLVQYPASNSHEILVNIMMGMGMEEWVDTQLQIKATLHAVKMEYGSHRAWFGAMYLVHGDAVVQKNLTFSELKKKSFSHTMGRTFGNDRDKNDGIMIGCGREDFVQELGSSAVVRHATEYSIPSRRRIQHVGTCFHLWSKSVDVIYMYIYTCFAFHLTLMYIYFRNISIYVNTGGPDDCNNDSNAFCWMSCLEIYGNGINTQAHLQNGEALYCLNPAVLADTNNVTYAVEVCADPLTGIAGGIMDERCGNYWLPKVEGVQSHVEYVHEFTPQYCYGQTAMYMQGFSWEGTTCLVYLFSSWVIKSRAALLLSCIGTIVFGIFTEYVIRKRRTVLKHFFDPRKRLAMSALLYGCQLTLGYMLMLVVMSYSGPLVLSVITGLVSGHIIWNYSDATVKNEKNTDVLVFEGSTPCCQNVVDDAFAEDKSTNSGDETTTRNCGCV